MSNARGPATVLGDVVYDKLFSSYAAYQERLRKSAPSILVAGYTGAGKSTFIKTLFQVTEEDRDQIPLPETGDGRPVTTTFRRYGPTRKFPARLVDSKGLEGASGVEQLRDLEDFVQHGRLPDDDGNEESIENAIQLVFYVVANNRWEPLDEKAVKHTLKAFYDRGNLLIIVSKCDIMTKAQQDDLVAAIKCDVGTNVKVFTVGSPPAGSEPRVPECCTIEEDGEAVSAVVVRRQKWKCDGCGKEGVLTTKPFGYDAIVNEALTMLPRANREAFLVAQKANFRQKRLFAYSAIGGASGAAGAVGFTPIPFSDWPLIMGAQAVMLATIAVVYDLELHDVRTLWSFLLAQVTVSASGLVIASGLKYIVGIGTLVGSLLEASVATTLTSTMGVSMVILVEYEQEEARECLRTGKKKAETSAVELGTILTKHFKTFFDEYTQHNAGGETPEQERMRREVEESTAAELREQSNNAGGRG